MQRLMEVILQGLSGTFVYLDDILLFNETEEEHVKLVDEVFKRLQENHMPLSIDKCEFAKKLRRNATNHDRYRPPGF